MPENPFEPPKEVERASRPAEEVANENPNRGLELAGLLVSLAWVAAALCGVVFLYFYIPGHK
jgi:hypothetical protein